MGKELIIAIVIVTAIFVFGCSGYSSKLTDEQKIMMDRCIEDIKKNNIDITQPDFEDPDITKKEYCYDSLSTKLKDYSFCTYIGHSELHDMCILRYSVATKDITMCSKMNLAAMKRNCEKMVNPTFILNPNGNN
jgi:hypothetical protein